MERSILRRVIFAAVLVACTLFVVYTVMLKARHAEQVISDDINQSVVKKVEVPVPVVDTSSVDTPINIDLQLMGVIISDNPKKSSAIITGPEKTTHFYFQGDTIADEIVLHRIYPNHVILLTHGKPKAMYLQWEQQQSIPQNGVIKSNDINEDGLPDDRDKDFLQRFFSPDPTPRPKKKIPYKINREQFQEKIRKRFQQYNP